MKTDYLEEEKQKQNYTLKNNMKEVLKSIGIFIKKFLGSTFDFVEKQAPKAVKVVQVFKSGIEEHGEDIEKILALSESEKDDEVFIFIKNELPKIAKELAIIDGLVDGDIPEKEALQIYASYILSKRKEGRAKEFIFLAAKVLGAILGKQLPIDVLVMVTQKAYRLIFKK